MCSQARRYSTYPRSGNSPRRTTHPPAHRPTNAGPPWSPTISSSKPCARSRTPSCTARSSTSGMVRHAAHRARRQVAVQVALTVAGCPLRNEITEPGQGRPSPPLAGVARRRARLHGDDRPGARGPAPHAPRQPRRHGRSGPGPRPRRGPQDPVQRARLEDPPAAHLVRQGRRRQVERHHQPRRRARRSRATRSASSTPTSTATRSRACSAPTATRSSSTRCSCRPSS